MRKKTKVSTPASKLRAQRARRAEVGRLHPRLLDCGASDGGKSELEIELKYFDGEPVIREIAGCPSRAGASMRRSRTLPRVANGLGISILSTPKGVMSDSRGAREQNVGGEVLCRSSDRWTRGIGKSGACLVSARNRVECPRASTATRRRPDRQGEGPEGRAEFVVTDDVVVAPDGDGIKVDPRDESKRARAMWGMSRTLVAEHGHRVSATGFERGWRSPASATAPRCRARTCSCARLQPRRAYPIPEGVTIAVPKPTEIVVSGIDKQRSARSPPRSAVPPPEPYKGKGVKLRRREILRKEGKKK
jgi:large subunit ribosomal protein L6